MLDLLVRRRGFHRLDDYLQLHPHVSRDLFRINTCYMPLSGPAWIVGGVRSSPDRSPLRAAGLTTPCGLSSRAGGDRPRCGGGPRVCVLALLSLPPALVLPADDRALPSLLAGEILVRRISPERS